MPIKKRDVEAALERKGFKKVESDHSFFIYYSQSDQKSRIRTKTSHGSGNKDISDNLLASMAKQCRLNNKQFQNLIACPLSRSEYENILIENGIVDNN
jgi:predicted RNA binding protein YcfA (HicA-like mRNA interferase family)